MAAANLCWVLKASLSHPVVVVRVHTLWGASLAVAAKEAGAPVTTAAVVPSNANTDVSAANRRTSMVCRPPRQGGPGGIRPAPAVKSPPDGTQSVEATTMVLITCSAGLDAKSEDYRRSRQGLDRLPAWALVPAWAQDPVAGRQVARAL